jgi:hypothetical protein
VRSNINNVENDLQEMVKNLREYKKLVDSYRADISSMENRSTLAIDDITSATQPEIDEIFSDLKKSI